MVLGSHLCTLLRELVCLSSLLPFPLTIIVLSGWSPSPHLDFCPSVLKAASIFSIKVQFLFHPAFLPNIILLMLSIRFFEWMVLLNSCPPDIFPPQLWTCRQEHTHSMKPLSLSHGQLHLLHLFLLHWTECLFSVFILHDFSAVVVSIYLSTPLKNVIFFTNLKH